MTDLVLSTRGALPEPVQLTLHWGNRYRLSVFNLGLACCALEFVAGAMTAGQPLVGGAGADAHLMVVSGTVTDKMAPLVQDLYAAMPERTYVVSFGACSNTGGPYWDSYCVTKGVDQLIPVDVYVPGCPPRPEALLHGIAVLAERLGRSAAAPASVTALASPLVPGP